MYRIYHVKCYAAMLSNVSSCSTGPGIPPNPKSIGILAAQEKNQGQDKNITVVVYPWRDKSLLLQTVGMLANWKLSHEISATLILVNTEWFGMCWWSWMQSDWDATDGSGTYIYYICMIEMTRFEAILSIIFDLLQTWGLCNQTVGRIILETLYYSVHMYVYVWPKRLVSKE